MRKFVYSFILFVLIPAILPAQAYEGTVEYNKQKHAAFIIEYSYSPEAVENAIIEKMEKLGYKAKEQKGLFNNDKGFRKYKNAYIAEVSESSHDYIIKIERKSRKQDDKSVVYLVMLNDDVNAKIGMDATAVTKAKTFLNNLQPDIEASDLELQIGAQEAAITRAEKKLTGLQDDKKAMEEKIRKLQQDIKDNEKDQEEAQDDIKKQKNALEVLRGKRKS